MWLITETPVTVRTAHGEVKLMPGVPHELSDAVGKRVLQCAGDRVRVHTQESAHPIHLDPAAPNARPVYWERADLSIVGPGQPEFLAKVGDGLQASYWVVAQFQGMPVWVNSDRLRSKRQFEQQVPPKIVEPVRALRQGAPTLRS